MVVYPIGLYPYTSKKEKNGMPKRITPLSDIQANKAKPKKKDYKLIDGFGLYLLVTTTGGKLWRFDYRFDGKRKLMAIGAYPTVTLAEARERREAARKLLANGVDPAQVKKAQKWSLTARKENSFEAVACEWHTKFSGQWSPSHAEKTLDKLKRDVLPWIGQKPTGEIKPPEILSILRRIEDRGALETARRVRIICGQVMRYAVATGRAEHDPTADLRGALPPVKEKHHAALTNPKDVAELLRAIDGFQGTFSVKCALNLAPLVFVRPGELRQMEWREIDFDNAQWEIPSEKMKMDQPHIVPLATQAVGILKELQPLTGSGRYVFPSIRSQLNPMSNNTINAALRRIGYTRDEMTGHGFRAMARTILDEILQVRPDFIEHQLAHAVRDPNGRAYNRTAHLAERRKMMQMWADYLDNLKAGTN